MRQFNYKLSELVVKTENDLRNQLIEEVKVIDTKSKQKSK